MGSAGAEKLNKSSTNLTELLFNGPAEMAEIAETFIIVMLITQISQIF